MCISSLNELRRLSFAMGIDGRRQPSARAFGWQAGVCTATFIGLAAASAAGDVVGDAYVDNSDGCLSAADAESNTTGPIRACASDTCSYEAPGCPGLFFSQTGSACVWGTLGSVSGTVDISVTAPNCSHLTQDFASIYARMSIDDLVISGPGNSVLASANLQVEGTLSFDHAPVCMLAGFNPQFGIGLELNGTVATGYLHLSAGPGGAEVHPDGVFSELVIGFDGHTATIASQMVTTADTSLPVNVPLELNADLGAGLAIPLQGGGGCVQSASESASVSVSLPFDAATPVLNLPPGYTANSLSANIVDNVWVFEDCNGNGVPDTLDIASDNSLDLNSDGVPDECECPQDINDDGVTNVLDLIDLLMCFGQPTGPPCDRTDLNGDNTTDYLDLLDLLMAFGTICP